MASNVIKMKRTAYNASGVPQASEVQYGEWAWSNNDSKMYFTAADTSDGSDRILYIRDLIPDATSGGSGSARGKASFNSTNFSVSTGYVAIATGGVVSSNLAANSVVTDKIQDNAVTADKIVDNVALPGNCSVTGDFTVLGDLEVDGTVTQIDSTQVTIKDKNIILAYTETGDPTTETGVDGAGITVGIPSSGTAPSLTWGITNDNWTFSHKTKITGGLFETEVDGGDFTGA